MDFPGDVGYDHRAPREGDRNGCAQTDAFGLSSGNRQGDEWIEFDFRRCKIVVTL